MRVGKLHHRTRDLTGQTFGVLLTLHPGGSNGKKRSWVFRCQCGEVVTKVGTGVKKEVKRGGVPNCGCLTKSLIGGKNRKHGMAKHPAYWVWRSMRDRCRLPSHQAYPRYGGRGIEVCKRWEESFESFWADMKDTYRSGLTLDRVDNNGGYTKGNCRWIDRGAQNRNRRDNLIVSTPKGDMVASEAADLFGIKRSTFYNRIRQGWPKESLFIKPNARNRVKYLI